MTGFFSSIPVLAMVIAGAGFFHQSGASATAGGVVINEVLVGCEGAAKREYVELYNAGAEAVDLAGWSLKKKTASGSESALVSAAKFTGQIPAGGYFLVTPPEYRLEFGGDLAYSGSTYSIATNNSVLLYGADGGLVDKAGWGAAADFESAPAPDPGLGVSLGRLPDGRDSEDNAVDLALGAPTPREMNRALGGNGPEADDGPAGNGPGVPAPVPAGAEKRYPFGAVLINEFVSDPADNDIEWVELANAWPGTVELKGWVLEEGGGAKTPVNGALAPDGPRRYLVVAKPKGNLNNQGDTIVLRDAGGAAVDSVAYGDWADGNPEDNAPAAGDPFSAGRCPDGVNSRNNAADFRVLGDPTKGRANDCSSAVNDGERGVAKEAGAAAGPVAALPFGLLFSEALPNPAGDDTAGEFIEFHNAGQVALDLCGWRVGDASNKRYRLSAGKAACLLPPGGFLAIKRADSGIALNNDTDAIRLFPPEGDEARLSLEYDGAREGLAFVCLDGQGKPLNPCAWSREPTPGAPNAVVRANRPPQPVLAWPEAALAGSGTVFDASDSIDDDNDRLSFHWDFGDGSAAWQAYAVHAFARAGDHLVVLSVGDGLATATAKRLVAVAPGPGADPGPGAGRDVIISEFLPDPDGGDEEEWIELYNRGDERVLLRDWRLDDSEGGSRPYTIKDMVWIGAGGYHLFERAETGLALNNNADAARLFRPDGRLADSAEYKGAKSGQSYARGLDGQWSWTAEPTPGAANSFKAAVKAAAVKSNAAKGSSAKTASVARRGVPLKDVRHLDAGDGVVVRGWVAVLPGALGSQYFYIHDQEGGVQVYSYKKDFPALKAGDFIEARGEIGIANSERRVKTKTRADILALEAPGAAPGPAAVKCEDLTEEAAGRLVVVMGEVSERRSSSVRLDDGTAEGLVYVKSATGISAARFRPGDRAEVTGIVALAADGARVLPRSNDDIRIARDTAGNSVLGAVEASSTWSLPARASRVGRYYAAVAAGFVLSMAGWWVWGRRNTADQ